MKTRKHIWRRMEKIFRSETCRVFTEGRVEGHVSKVILSAGNDKRLKALEGVIYPYAMGAGRVCKAELIEYAKKKK